MNPSLPRRLAQALLTSALLLCAACVTTGSTSDEGEPVLIPGRDTGQAEEQEAPDAEMLAQDEPAPESGEPEDIEEEGEVPLSVAATERGEEPRHEALAEVVVQAEAPQRHEIIHGLVGEAQQLLRGYELKYAFTGTGRKEALRGRPVAFALWSESRRDWTIALVEIPRPPVKWKPGGKPLPFTLLTPGLTATHVKGTGAERLMFAFSRNGEPLKVYGRKFPVFDGDLVKKKKWRAVVDTATPIVYLPFTEDTLDPVFVSGGRDYLLATARKAVDELRAANAPSIAFPAEQLADVVPAEVISTLAVIEQTDDGDFRRDPGEAVNEVLSHYGLKRDEAYRYSVSRAAAIGPMQFTNKRGNGTYAMVVRRCPAARLDPDFERGATDLLNAMKAAICLFDIELAQMRAEIRNAYHDNKQVLGIFPVAAYNGGPRNVTKLFKVMTKMKVKLDALRPPGDQPDEKAVTCPCLWTQTDDGVQPVTIPRYNNENRWYVEKYQSILGVFG